MIKLEMPGQITLDAWDRELREIRQFLGPYGIEHIEDLYIELRGFDALGREYFIERSVRLIPVLDLPGGPRRRRRRTSTSYFEVLSLPRSSSNDS
ncbi:hypothetical protein [Glacieibacterium frigidum]|uniref:Uncharacterized protein n=1 Tax=Glacieibacterium frigidum TaxID=2593303 RepID=A0A552UAA3_9SPHN|nr:hypothetical protein [Glacieibacterium frigidum]TRW15142.1 hypothetical protein FMM06_15990 [Glacieibacterium frigidum]